MAKLEQQCKTYSTGFKLIQLFKHPTLGVGSYGKVCKAKCDNLLCAAKIIHETLFNPLPQHVITPKSEHRQPMRRFEQECEFLSTIRHPNIVQYLGMYQDPDTSLPVLLMELMDDSLTNYLESSAQPIPYHILVNFSHDMALALSFLHSNGITHRDLSSNNVLLIQNVRAKLTDFGMARLGISNPQIDSSTHTVCPGTDVYMAPEAVQDKPKYTEKIDCFSFGVVVLQMLTREFPNPGDRRQVIPSDCPGVARGVLELRVPEVDRRQEQINKVDQNHPLLEIVLNCLKDNDIDRPSAQYLCERVSTLKDTSEYNESQTYSEETHEHTSVIDTVTSKLAQHEQLHSLASRYEEKLLQLHCLIEEKESQLEHIQQQLVRSQCIISDYQSQICRLEMQLQSDSQQKRSASKMQLNWRAGERTPCKVSRRHDAIVNKKGHLYIIHDCQVYEYSKNQWYELPVCSYNGCSIAIVNDLLTTIGGFQGSDITNQLFSLTGEGSSRTWTEEFPPMPTKRDFTTALCAETALIVIGGMNEQLVRLRTVEVMNTETLQWSNVAHLPEKLYLASATVCGDNVYLQGGWKDYRVHNDSVYTCSLKALLQSSAKTRGGHLASALSLQSSKFSVWRRIAKLAVTQSTCVCLNGQLLAIGGYSHSDKSVTADIHLYSEDTESWEVISHMSMPRCKCFAAILPGNQLMVVGGDIKSDLNSEDKTDSVETALSI